MNHINLLLRFFLEIAAIIIFGLWGWKLGNGLLKIALAIIIPITFMAIWGVFAVPKDPSRSGKTLIKTPGIIRLIIEFCFFTLATLALFYMKHEAMGIVFCLAVLFHYAWSYNRVKWLLLK